MGQRGKGWKLGLASLAVLGSASASAANQGLQDLFFAACQAPTAALAARCAETNAGLGNLSGDSESSLNPSQGLSGTTLSQSVGQARVAAAGGVPADGEGAGAQVSFGNWSVLWHLRHQRDEWERTVDADLERGFEADTTVMEVGVERSVSANFAVGALAMFERSTLEFDAENAGVNFTPVGDAGSIDRDSNGLLGYLAWLPSDQSFVDLSISYLWEEHEIERRSVFQESSRTIAQTLSVTDADTDGTRLSVQLNGGRQFALGQWQAVASLGLGYLSAETDGYQEADLSGTGLAMRFSDADRSATTARLGLSLQRALSLDSGVLVPQLQLGYETDLDRDESGYRAGYVLDAAGATTALQADEASDRRLTLRAGLHWILPEGWMPFLQLSAVRGNEGYDSLQIAAGLRKRF